MSLEIYCRAILEPGLKIRRPTWSENAYIYFSKKEGNFINNNGISVSVAVDNSFELYEEPKKKVKKTFYKGFFIDDDILCGTNYYYSKQALHDMAILRGWKIVEIEEREFEVEVWQ